MILYDKNLGRYCIWAKSAHGCDLCPERSIRFLGEKCLKKALHKNFLKTKVVINHNTQLLGQRLFRSPKGCGLCPDGIIRFFDKKCLKNALYKIVFQTKVVKNQILQLLCYVIFFDILHHYGVIVASQICSVSRKYCAVLRNRFFFFLFCLLRRVRHG